MKTRFGIVLSLSLGLLSAGAAHASDAVLGAVIGGGLGAVVGNQVGAATATLEAAGLHVKVQKLLPGINFGTVQSTDPAAGTQIPKGSTVTLKTV